MRKVGLILMFFRMNKSSGPLCVAEACVEIHCYIFENQNKAL